MTIYQYLIMCFSYNFVCDLKRKRSNIEKRTHFGAVVISSSETQMYGYHLITQQRLLLCKNTCKITCNSPNVLTY